MLYIAQVKDAGGVELTGELLATGEIRKEQEKTYKKKLKAQRRLGLPRLRDADRIEKIEQISQEMCAEGRAAFWPLDKYSLRIKN